MGRLDGGAVRWGYGDGAGAAPFGGLARFGGTIGIAMSRAAATAGGLCVGGGSPPALFGSRHRGRRRVHSCD
jgi:hypothetical protein